VLVYSVILLLICAGLAASIYLRHPFKVDVVRDRGTLARLVEDGAIENGYRLQFMNATEQTQRLRVTVSGLPGVRVVGRSELELAPAEARWLPLAVQLSADAAVRLSPGAHDIRFDVERVDGLVESPARLVEKSTFVIPR
jgi:polyferredoxin